MLDLQTRFFIHACSQLFNHPLYPQQLPHVPLESHHLSILIHSASSVALREYLTVIASTAIMPNLALQITVCGDTAPFTNPDNKEYYIGAEQQAGLWKNRITVTFSPTPPKKQQYDRIYCDPDLLDQYKDADPELIGQTTRQLPAELERMALNCDYIYNVQSEHPVSPDDLKQKLQAQPYNYKASVLQALHVPTKLFCCGINPDPRRFADAAQEYFRLIHSDKFPMLAGHMAALEHNRWCVPLWLQGWRAMTSEDLETVFQSDADGQVLSAFKNKDARWHSLLVPCSDPMKRPLIQLDRALWDSEEALPADIDRSLDELDRSSLVCHRHALKMRNAQLAQAKEIARKLLKQPSESKPLRGVLNAIAEAIDQLEKAPGQSAAHICRQTLADARQLLSADTANANLSQLVQQLEHCMASCMAYVQFRDPKLDDAASAELLPVVLLFDAQYNAMIRELSPRIEDDAMGMLILDPKDCTFLIPDNMPTYIVRPLERSLRAFVQQRNMRTRLHFRQVSGCTPQGWAQAIAEAGAAMENSAPLFDLTGAGAPFSHAAVGKPSVIVRNGQLINYANAAPAEVFNSITRKLSCADALLLSDRKKKLAWSINNWAEIQAIIPDLFRRYLDLTDRGIKENEEPETADKRYTDFASFLEKNAQYVAKAKAEFESIQFPKPVSGAGSAQQPIEFSVSPVLEALSGIDAAICRLAESGVIVKESRTNANGSTGYRITPLVSLTEPQKLQLQHLGADAAAPYSVSENDNMVKLSRRPFNPNIYKDPRLLTAVSDQSQIKVTVSSDTDNASRLNAVYAALNDFGILTMERTVDKNQVRYDLTPQVLLATAQLDQLKMYAENASAETPYVIERKADLLTPGKEMLEIRQIYTTFAMNQEQQKKYADALQVFDGYILPAETNAGKYSFSSNAVRQILLKSGNILEDYLFWALSRSGLFSDVQMSYEFETQDGFSSQNEVDVIAMVDGKHTIFFSCKAGIKIDSNDIVEIARHRNSLGLGNAKAVFVTSCSEASLQKLQMDADGDIARRAREELNVYMLDRTVLRDAEKLNTFLTNLVRD